MKSLQPMKILVVEDDIEERQAYKDLSERRKDIQFVGMTGSSNAGIAIYKEALPDGVILDLELNRGQGSGLAFLRGISDCPHKAIIVVATHTQLELLHHVARTSGVAWVSWKRQEGFAAETLIDEMLFIHTINRGGQEAETAEEGPDKAAVIRARAEEELDLLGISTLYKGRNYLLEAICLLLNNEVDRADSVLNTVAKNNSVSYSSVLRAMQTAINNAWYKNDIKHLSKYYTARIDVRTGVPTPSEFLHFYYEKLRKEI